MQLSFLSLEKSKRGNSEFPFYIYELGIIPDSEIIHPHWHKEIEIMYCTGDGYAELDNVNVTFAPCDIFIANKEVIHLAHSFSGGTFYAIVFDYDFLDFAKCDYCQQMIINKLKASTLEFPPVINKDTKQYDRIHDIIKETIQLYFNQPFGYQLKIKCNLYELIFILYSEDEFITPSDNSATTKPVVLDYIRQSIRYMEEHYASPITVDELAKLIRISPFYFIKSFKHFTNMTPIEYLINLRLEFSATMFQTSHLSVTQVCYDVGFNNISYFIKKFKAKYNMTPKEFIKMKNKTN